MNHERFAQIVVDSECPKCGAPKATYEPICSACQTTEVRLVEVGRSMVYAISGAGMGNAPIKFGFTTNPKSRLAELQVGSPVELAYLAIADGRRGAELMIHRFLLGQRSHGEWFRRGPKTELVLDHLTRNAVLELLPKICVRGRLRHGRVRENQ